MKMRGFRAVGRALKKPFGIFKGIARRKREARERRYAEILAAAAEKNKARFREHEALIAAARGQQRQNSSRITSKAEADAIVRERLRHLDEGTAKAEDIHKRWLARQRRKNAVVSGAGKPRPARTALKGKGKNAGKRTAARKKPNAKKKGKK